MHLKDTCAIAGVGLTKLARRNPGTSSMGFTLEGCKTVNPETDIEPVESAETARLQAQRMLELAMNYERAGTTDKAREIFQSLITYFPQTKAAEEAKKRVELLDKP